jgi:hypothetical protein
MRFPVIASFALAALVALASGGCGTSTSKGPGGQELTLVKPADQTLTRGESNRVAVAITRDEFEGPVEVEFEDLPSGVRVVEGDVSIPADKNVMNFTLVADATAELVAEKPVRVVVKGPNGLETSVVFEVTVKEKS